MELEVTALAQQLFHSLLADVDKAITREEHIRLTARANEAENLLNKIQAVPDESAA
jgi:hypothetical protein